ncbi:MAG: DUF4292 domain-containing protein [Flavobacteriales bacterium]|nr:DUF4292 domain-containing protein [Flavobacteriales bacterium]
MNKGSLLLFAVFILFIFQSCKSGLEVSEKRQMRNMELQELVDSIKANEAKPNGLAMRAKVSFKVEKTSESFKMHVRLQRDSLIWISATYYKVEVARFLFSPDSVIMVDRKNGKYYKGNYQFIQEKFQVPFTFRTLQATLLGNCIELEDEMKMRSIITKGKYVLAAQKVEQNIDSVANERHEEVKRNYVTWIEPEGFRVYRSKMNESKSKKGMVITYSNWQKVDNCLIPFMAKCKVTDKNEIFFDAEYSKIETVVDQSYPLTISDKYEPYF